MCAYILPSAIRVVRLHVSRYKSQPKSASSALLACGSRNSFSQDRFFHSPEWKMHCKHIHHSGAGGLLLSSNPFIPILRYPSRARIRIRCSKHAPNSIRFSALTTIMIGSVSLSLLWQFDAIENGSIRYTWWTAVTMLVRCSCIIVSLITHKMEKWKCCRSCNAKRPVQQFKCILGK